VIDFEARRVIEALRSGVPSRTVGQYFSSARQDILTLLTRKLTDVSENGVSGGMVITGKYGEGKTHLLNTVFNMAQTANMVVSLLPLGKETPLDKPFLIYQKVVQNTYLPKHRQPGFLDALSNITPHSPVAEDMTAYTAKSLTTDKLFYLFRAYLHADDPEEKYMLLADLEGDFIGNIILRQTYKRIFADRCVFKTTFSKTKHMDDYFAMLSHLFLQLGYDGWVILFDEMELTGRLGKKTRLNAYKNMASFLFPAEYSHLQSTFSLFTVTDSYAEEVIEKKHDYENLGEASYEPNDADKIRRALDAIESAVQLKPLTKNEILFIMEKLVEFYRRAYDWYPNINMADLYASTDNRGYLLRTRIRAVVECLDQLYQYNQMGNLRIDELGQMNYEEDISELTAE